MNNSVRLIIALAITIIAVAYASLNFKDIKLGLDLRGGSYLLLSVDFDEYMDEQVENLKDSTRAALIDKKLGYKNLSTSKDKVSVEILGEFDEYAIRREVDPRVMSVASANKLEIFFKEEELKKIKSKLIEQSIEIIRRRVDETGTREPIIQRQGEERILLQVPGLENPEELKDLLGKTAKLTFHLLHRKNNERVNNPNVPLGFTTKSEVRGVPGGYKLAQDKNGLYYLIQKRAIVSGENLVDSNGTIGQDGQPVVDFTFDTSGGRKFGNTTRDNIGKPFAIMLDNVILSAPVIRSHINGGSGIIEGNFTHQEVNELATLLRAGALPAPIEVLEERSVGPSLGQDSIDAGKIASIIALVLVVILMLIYYRLYGLFASIALTINLVLVFAIIIYMGATLTLPGIAGLILTVGMAVDANVLIFERIKEEKLNRKSSAVAIDKGFEAAYNTILDSNITTLIGAVILFAFGTGPVKGFAVTLSIGILCSMFSALVLTRSLVTLRGK